MGDCYFQKRWRERGQLINIDIRNNTPMNLPTHTFVLCSIVPLSCMRGLTAGTFEP